MPSSCFLYPDMQLKMTFVENFCISDEILVRMMEFSTYITTYCTRELCAHPSSPA